jgi:hypothetical protein
MNAAAAEEEAAARRETESSYRRAAAQLMARMERAGWDPLPPQLLGLLQDAVRRVGEGSATVDTAMNALSHMRDSYNSEVQSAQRRLELRAAAEAEQAAYEARLAASRDARYERWLAHKAREAREDEGRAPPKALARDAVLASYDRQPSLALARDAVLASYSRQPSLALARAASHRRHGAHSSFQ